MSSKRGGGCGDWCTKRGFHGRIKLAIQRKRFKSAGIGAERERNLIKLIELRKTFEVHCNDYMDDIVKDQPSKAVEFCSKVIYEVGPESRKVNKSTEDKVWKFTFNINKKMLNLSQKTQRTLSEEDWIGTIVKNVNQSTQRDGHYLSNSDIDFAICASYVALQNMKKGILRKKTIVKIIKQYMTQGHEPNKERLRIISIYAIVSIPIDHVLDQVEFALNTDYL
ncbi:LOW QUALITY PROTEIN: uncharacterized protein LOC143175230 [Nomia melanderi]|uniref:LOW QUALITY PROTEIN: uncharacterized protein LOC143175230 n=1 Tax=Nomia melanderi TaxID=2448451 RepID=UPI003FCE27E6